jgi:alpha-tubulin suppressor-like RCC1 family protein
MAGASGAAGSGGGIAGDPRVLSAGFHHSCAADTTGGLSCWGQLGYQDKPFDESWRPFGRDFSRKPTPVGGTSGVGLATSGSTHACFGLGLGPTYGLSCFGSNQEGQLGNPNTAQDPGGPPSLIPNEDWSTASAGNLHTCAVRGGNLFCWGFNLNLQISQPDELDEQPLPSQVGGENDWKAISAGYSHTCGVRGGHLHCWGGNFTGQLGTGEVSPPLAYDRDREVDVAGGWASVASGVAHTCALSSAGDIHCWGSNNSGQSGEGADPAPPHKLQVEGPWLELSAGRRHTCAIKQGGLIYCWGQNAFGQLGRDIGGAPFDRVPAPISDVGPWTHLEAGADHTCARRQLGGEVYCWGRNDFGQCGQQNTDPVKAPARVVF